jgi:ABC-type polysaccharide/polyol phosphate export permease
LKLSHTIRQVHRWLSIAFTAGVLIYVTAMILGRPPAWLGVFPLLPLVSLLATGLYMFVLPYFGRPGTSRRLPGGA